MADSAPCTSTRLDAESIMTLLTRNHTFERLRQSTLAELQQHPGLQAKVEEALLQSQAYQRHSGDAKRLFQEAKRELEAPLGKEALAALWEVLSAGPVAQKVEAAVQEAACQLHEPQQRKLAGVDGPKG